MTSKEKLLNILKHYKLADKGNEDFLSDNYQEELLNPILNDLETLDILKPRIKLKESSLNNAHYNFDEQGNIIMEQDLKETLVVFIQSSGFVLENSAEHKTLKRWLNNEKEN